MFQLAFISLSTACYFSCFLLLGSVFLCKDAVFLGDAIIKFRCVVSLQVLSEKIVRAVTLRNQGIFPETFNITLYANFTTIACALFWKQSWQPGSN